MGRGGTYSLSGESLLPTRSWLISGEILTFVTFIEFSNCDDEEKGVGLQLSPTIIGIGGRGCEGCGIRIELWLVVEDVVVVVSLLRAILP